MTATFLRLGASVTNPKELDSAIIPNDRQRIGCIA